ncbi:MAG: alpha/beta hydrolase [Sneathiella sp.]|uniref:alpha/beta fold hydrolase n=1 Tax=Sneathiella sp. TaxID=1964365 RepID=UPI003001E866
MPDFSFGSMIMEVEGEGLPVVMIHGLGGTSNSFQTLLPALDGYKTYRPDLPGAGRSGLRPGRADLKGLASAVFDMLQAAGVKKAHFVGHSMGTLICQYLAAGSTGIVDGMTLFGPLLEPPVAARQALKERGQQARTGQLAAIANSISAGSVSEGSPVASAFVRESILRQNPSGYANHCDALSVASAADHTSINVPTLLVAGDADPVAPVSMAQQLAKNLTTAHLEIIPEVGHWMMVEAPGRSTELLRNHLAAVYK